MSIRKPTSLKIHLCHHKFPSSSGAWKSGQYLVSGRRAATYARAIHDDLVLEVLVVLVEIDQTPGLPFRAPIKAKRAQQVPRCMVSLDVAPVRELVPAFILQDLVGDWWEWNLRSDADGEGPASVCLDEAAHDSILHHGLLAPFFQRLAADAVDDLALQVFEGGHGGGCRSQNLGCLQLAMLVQRIEKLMGTFVGRRVSE